MQYTYKLQVDFGQSQSALVTNLLGVEPTFVRGTNWELQLKENENDKPLDYVSKFLAIIDGKWDELAALGIRPADVTVWLFYAYRTECNLEFHAHDLKRLGDAGLTLCISCWQENGVVENHH